jgi:inner membrane protein
MDPLAHTLAGAALAETRLARGPDGSRLPLATATLLMAANLPDVDVFSYVRGGDFALGFRRGWTHGVLAMVVLPLVLWGVLLAWQRWVRRPRGTPPAPAGRLLLLAYVGVLSHPLLDWLNVYGVRLLMPFSGRWFYGDAVFIVDPWIWLVLGCAVYLARRPHPWSGRAFWAALAGVASYALVTRGVDPSSPGGRVALAVWGGGLLLTVVLALADRRPSTKRGPRLAAGALAAVALYAGAMAAYTQLARRQVAAELARRGVELVDGRRPGGAYRLMVAPVPVDPLRREVVAVTPESYWTGRFDWGAEPRLAAGPELPRGQVGSVGMTPELLRRALDHPEVAGFADWVRFPWLEAEPVPGGGTRVWLMDVRYTRRPTEGFGGAVVELE